MPRNSSPQKERRLGVDQGVAFKEKHRCIEEAFNITSVDACALLSFFSSSSLQTHLKMLADSKVLLLRTLRSTTAKRTKTSFKFFRYSVLLFDSWTKGESFRSVLKLRKLKLAAVAAFCAQLEISLFPRFAQIGTEMYETFTPHV